MKILSCVILCGLLSLTSAAPGWAQDAPTSAAGDLSSMALPDAPPGLGAQMAFYGVGAESPDEDCTFDPTVVGDQTCAIQVGSSQVVWFDGFDDSQGVQVSVTWPNGHVERLVATSSPDMPDDPTPMLSWDVSPDKPQGTYAVEATQGASRVNGSFSVFSAPAVSTVTPNEGPPGTQFTVSLTGLPAGQEIHLRIYRSLSASQTELGGNYFYVTSLGPIRTDANGNASYSLRTAAGDRTGHYLVESDPSVNAEPLGFSLLGTGQETMDQERTALVQSIVQSADELWGSVVANSDAGTDVLDTAFGGDRLMQVQAELSVLRAAGQHIDAHLTTPVVVLSSTGSIDKVSSNDAANRVDAVIQEQLEVRTVNADGSLAASQSGPVVHHIVLQESSKDLLWRIVTVEDAH